MKNMCTLLLLTFVLTSIYCNLHAQSTATAQKYIEQANKKFVTWFNTGKADSIVAQYHVNACKVDLGCGTEFLKKYFSGEIGKYTFKEITTTSVTVKDKIATETGAWRIQLASGSELSGKYRSEWQRVNNKWLILKEEIVD